MKKKWWKNNIYWIICIILLALFMLAMMIGCSVISPNLKYVRQLRPDIKKWYSVHAIFMDGLVPDWIDARAGKQISERVHFLRLPLVELQEKYMQMFWKIRWKGLQEIFYYRLSVLERTELGVHSDRGYIYLKYGSPNFVYSYRDISRQGTPYSNDVSIEGTSLIFWEYIFGGNRIARYAFQWQRGIWGAAYSGLYDLGEQGAHHAWFVEVWSPTNEGWTMWASELLHWVQEHEGHKN